MKLFQREGDDWQYLLSSVEADVLSGLLKRFPLCKLAPAQFSKSGMDAKALERGALLNEALAEHRQELEQIAASLLNEDKWQKTAEGQLLLLDTPSREILLQILNDIRVGNWRELGKPESLDGPVTAENLTRRQLIDLAGYFEMALIDAEDTGGVFG
jgi:hypothetical protein